MSQTSLVTAVGHQPRRRAQADDVVERRRVADAAAVVGAVGDRHQARGERRARPAAADPPAERSSAHGLRVAPNTSLNVCEPTPNSGVFVLPTTIAPAAFSRVHDQAVDRGDVVGKRDRAVRRADPGRVLEVLDRDRQPVQRPERLADRRRGDPRRRPPRAPPPAAG